MSGLNNQQFESPQEALAHYGVKGMRWGVRKDRSTSTNFTTKDEKVKVGSDGSMTIPKGTSIQRLVRSSGKSRPLKDITYASINDYDNARYIKIIGGKGFFGGGRDQILSIVTTKPLRAPSIDEATKIVSDLMLNNKTFRARNTTPIGNTISKRELEKIRSDPLGKTARAWYHETNTKLSFDAGWDPDAPAVQKIVKKKFMEKGYNALRDENDFRAGLAKAPVIIFEPESLKVTTVTQITDALRSANKEKLKEYKRKGKDWVEKELYA